MISDSPMSTAGARVSVRGTAWVVARRQVSVAARDASFKRPMEPSRDLRIATAVSVDDATNTGLEADPSCALCCPMVRTRSSAKLTVWKGAVTGDTISRTKQIDNTFDSLDRLSVGDIFSRTPPAPSSREAQRTKLRSLNGRESRPAPFIPEREIADGYTQHRQPSSSQSAVTQS